MAGDTLPPRFGEMAELIDRFDWADTSLGAKSSWPAPLQCAVDIALPSRAQIVMFCGPEFVAIYNDAYVPTIGSKHPHALGRPAREGWAELWSDLEPLLQRVLENGETVFAKDRPFYIERHAQPETAYFDISYSPVFDTDGKVLAVLCIVNETTDRMRFEGALRQNEERLRTIIDQTTVGVVQSDSRGQLSFVNPGFCKLLGYSEDEVLGKTLEEFTHPDDLPRNLALIKKLFADGESFVFEKRYIRKDGAPIWVSNHVSALKDDSGSVREAIAVVVDITERRRALEAERRLAAIISSSEDAILGIDLSMMVTDWNAGAQHLYGYANEEILGKPVTMLIPEERIDEEKRIIERIKTGERVDPHETVRRHKSGRLVDVSLSVSPIYDANGRIVGASKIARDISARKEAERVQNILIGEMNHRVKNVLATVVAIARQTFRSATDMELAGATFDARLQSLARAHDLLTRGNWEKAGLKDVVLEALAPYPGDHYEVSGPELTVAPSAVVALSLALHELATNAAKYGAFSVPTGRVTVSWQIVGSKEPQLRLVWQEIDGPNVVEPSKRGFGSRLINGLIAGQLNGQANVTFNSSGVRCEIEAPINISWSASDRLQSGTWSSLTLGKLDS